MVTVTVNAIQFIPGAQLLKSRPEDAAVREQERLERASGVLPNLQNPFVPAGRDSGPVNSPFTKP